MKKVISLLLLLSLVLIITGCDNFGLNDGEGFGKLLVSKAYIEDGTEVTSGTVKVDGKEAGFGEEIVLAKGSYRVTVNDDAGNVATLEGIVIKVAETTVINDVVLGKPLHNAMKLVFDPATFGGNTVENADKIKEVKVKGNITDPNWVRLDNLTENDDGTWSVIVPAVDDYSKEFGFVYWLDANGDGDYDDPEDKADEWAGGNPAGGNYTVETAIQNGVASEVIGMKLVYDPATFGGNTVENADKIKEVKVKGNITDENWARLDNLTKNNDGTWSVIVPSVDDYSKEFGFVYWLDANEDGDYDDPEDKADEWAGENPAGGNYTVETAIRDGVILLDF